MHLTTDIPAPMLFNAWKHHAGFIRQQIVQVIQAGAASLDALPSRLQVVGTDLMDVYTGTLAPVQIAEHIAKQLAEAGRLPPASYWQWLQIAGGFQVLNLPDQSRWVLRKGTEEERYVHIHPGRWSPQTRRVRANVLKTAILVVAHASSHGGDPLDIKLINDVRRRLELSPVAKVEVGQGLSEVIQLLREQGR